MSHQVDDLTPLQRMIAEMRSRLRPGGPPVDRAAVRAYLAGALVEDERRLVSERIETWWDWFETWRELLPATDPELEDDASVPPASDKQLELAQPSLTAIGAIPSTLSAVRFSQSGFDPVSVALRILAALAPAIGSAITVATRAEGSEGSGSGEDAVRERLASGGTVAVSSGLGWLSCSVRGDSVRLKLRRSATEPYPPFRIAFCRGGVVALEVLADADTVMLVPEHLPLVAAADVIRVLPV